MLLDSHISTLRTTLKEFTDDTVFTNEFLADILVSARNNIYETEFIQKKRKFSRFSYFNFCIKLEEDTFHDCSCVPDNLGCKILKSVIDIPKCLIDKNGNLLLNVYTINGDRIDYKPFQERRLLRSHPVTSKVLSYDIINNKLFIFGSLKLKIVIIEAVWEDPFSLYNVPKCDNTGNILSNNCWNPLEDDFPFERNFDLQLYITALKLLGIKTIEDNSENGQNNTNQSI